MNDPDIFHVADDILHVRRPFFPTCRYSISLLPASSERNRRHASDPADLYLFIRRRREFERNRQVLRSELPLNAAQYTSHHRMNRALSVLLVHDHLNTNKDENERLLQVPTENTGVFVAGVLESVETNSAEHATLFHVAVDDVNSSGIIT